MAQCTSAQVQILKKIDFFKNGCIWQIIPYECKSCKLTFKKRLHLADYSLELAPHSVALYLWIQSFSLLNLNSRSPKGRTFSIGKGNKSDSLWPF